MDTVRTTSERKPSSSYYAEDTSIEDLLRRVDAFQLIEEEDTLERLEKENAVLKRQISSYRASWQAALALLHEAFEAVIQIQTALRVFDQEEENANRDWLSFWGIHMEAPSNLVYWPIERPKEWI